MVGEVWICSGQSNMAWKLRNSLNVSNEIPDANWKNICMFSVERTVSDSVEENCQGEWQVCSSETVGDFSTVGYFFGRDLHKKLNIPVGLIHTSWGGTPAESWTGWTTLAADSDFAPILDRFQDVIENYPGKWSTPEKR